MKKRNKILLFVVILLLCSCKKDVDQIDTINYKSFTAEENVISDVHWVTPDEHSFDDCIFANITKYTNGHNMGSYTIVRCPNSATTTTVNGKYSHSVTVVDK